MLEAIGTSFTAVISWLGEFVTALVGTEGVLKDLLPIVCIGIGIVLLGRIIGYLKSLIWGI